MQEECIVKSIKGELAIIVLAKGEQCNGCRGCAFGKNPTVSRRAITQVPVKAGDRVIVEMPQRQISGAFAWLYIVPIIGLFIGLFIGIWISELMGAIFAVTGCALSFIVVLFINKSYRKRKEFLPVIKEIITHTISNIT